ncbi:hypothetical protein Xcc3_01150 [Xanthomonas campestris pv. campestris]|nr:hypothetical protein Xcc1_01160 [Xanthomonas campestris pv. campestris]BBJ98807.1 hypothetical protein Xcc3_01150 [Xanthomonas campestris pv. campestris]
MPLNSACGGAEGAARGTGVLHAANSIDSVSKTNLWNKRMAVVLVGDRSAQCGLRAARGPQRHPAGNRPRGPDGQLTVAADASRHLYCTSAPGDPASAMQRKNPKRFIGLQSGRLR